MHCERPYLYLLIGNQLQFSSKTSVPTQQSAFHSYDQWKHEVCLAFRKLSTQCVLIWVVPIKVISPLHDHIFLQLDIHFFPFHPCEIVIFYYGFKLSPLPPFMWKTKSMCGTSVSNHNHPSDEHLSGLSSHMWLVWCCTSYAKFIVGSRVQPNPGPYFLTVL
jgi:hypothetical protein